MALLWAGAGACTIQSEEMVLRPVADTTIHAITPLNNMGRHTHVAMGTTAKGTAARGLFRFDLGALPTNAVVSSVSITFTLPALNRPDSGGAVYAAHRMLKSWGEGAKSGNLGALATAGESSWEHSVSPVTWGAPGGEAGVDFVGTASGTGLLGPAPGTYSMETSAGLVADVEHWLAQPEENFGWLIMVEDESETQSARQFASRETANGAVLRVQYAMPLELRITGIERVETNVVIRWTGGQGSVGVERIGEMGGEWELLGESSEGVFTNELSEEREFLRLRVENSGAN